MRPRFGQAALTTTATVVSFGCTYALCGWLGAKPGPAILAAILTLSLSGRAGRAPEAPLVFLPATIALTAMAAAGIGWLLLTHAVAGAVLFTAGVFGSVWLRNFGPRGRIAGRIIAMPLVGILIAPARADAPGGFVVDLLLVVAAAVCAASAVAVTAWCAARAGSPAAIFAAATVAGIKREQRARFSPTTRLALQMGVGIGLAFGTGFVLFPAHWGWCVLTAFIVNSGIRSRGDAAYKGALRLLGALAGTIAAALLTRIWVPSGIAEAAAIFTILYLGLALRELNYAYWAACMTLVLALIAQPAGSSIAFLGLRLAAILAGALCAGAAAWYVAPIKLEAVIRRRLADALAALDDVVGTPPDAHAERQSKHDLLAQRMRELEHVSPPARWHRRMFGRGAADAHPATWVELATVAHARVQSFAGAPAGKHLPVAAVRRAIGVSRRAIAMHGPDAPAGATSITAALHGLHETLFDQRSASET